MKKSVSVIIISLFVSIFLFSDWDSKWLDINNYHICITNFGVIGMDFFSGNGGAYWPAGYPDETYFFGSGLWFGSLVDTLVSGKDTLRDTLVTSGYYPSAGVSEFIPGNFSDTAYYTDPKLIVYISTSDNNGYGWPIKNITGKDSIFSDQDSYSWYSDKDSSYHFSFENHPIGIEVFQFSYAWTSEPLKDIIIFKFKIQNTREDKKKIKDCYAALSFDLDIGDESINKSNDLLGFIDTMTVKFISDKDTMIRMNTVYQFQLDSEPGWHSLPGIPSFVVLETPPAKKDMDLYGNGVYIIKEGEELGLTSFRKLTIETDPSNKIKKYLSLAGYDFISFNPEDPGSSYSPFPDWGVGVIGYPGHTEKEEEKGDKRFIISTGPFDIEYNQSINYVVAFVMNKTPDEIIQNSWKIYNFWKSGSLASIDELDKGSSNEIYFDVKNDIFTDFINISLSSDKSMNFNIDLYDIQGRKIMNLYNGILNRKHQIKLKLNIPAGVYIVRCNYEINKTITKKIRIIK
ncbi:MAG: T9SS type A sorting domain-containing protein [candidate division WOR-3 bacterium]